MPKVYFGVAEVAGRKFFIVCVVLYVEVLELSHVFAQSLQWHIYVLYLGVGARVEHPLDSTSVVLEGLRGRLRRASPASGSVSAVTEPLSGVQESIF